eukprot:CAMPEP_0197270576 /NCGR_PEP_ID=MMETSP1432-20130617/7365_1 /TAXON_ID=44447 /ORGANISM="Pseudo-nitzschia delicatissima, Strain UNC1205" /LENGTH=431 /DNA_ID=CAMNT_0042735885 /DNA_START=17 /DNA_END=1312 /DNA_ORIENTATION=+
MTKPDSPSEMRGKNFSPQKRGKFDFLFLDCCAFVHAGLGFDDDIAPCASIALIDSDDGGSSLSDDSFSTFTKTDLSTLFEDLLTVDASFEKNEIPKNDDDSKLASTIFTISTLTMEKMVGMNTVLQTKEEDEEQPSKLVLLSENLVTGGNRYPEDEEWSRTFNTLSTARLPPSLDTKTAEITPSLDTKTLDKTLEGLKLVGTTVGETTQENTGRNASNPTYAQPLKFYDIDRVPSMVDASERDDQSVVSGMSFEEYAALFGKDKETGAKSPTSPITKRLLKAKGKILRPWSWKNRKTAKDNGETAVAMELREPFGAVPITNVQPTSRTEQSRSSATLTKSSLPVFVPKPTSTSPQRLSKRPTETYRLTVPVIKLTKSNDITASTVGTDEDNDGNNRFGDDVPFDEPHACSPRILRVGQYLRPSSNVEIGEI